MSSSQKASSASSRGAAFLGAVVLGSLALTSCSASASDSKPQPSSASASASVSASAATQNFADFKSNAFDLSKQTPINVPNPDTGIYLADGVVSQDKGNDSIVIYTPYENKNSAWKYTAEIPVGDHSKIGLMRWKDKSYIVLEGVDETKQPASGLDAAKNIFSENVIVLDAATGKTVNAFKGDPSEGGPTSDRKMFQLNRPSTIETPETYTSFMTGLPYRNNDMEKLVDPLTGATVATAPTPVGPDLLNNETGFYKNDNLNINQKGSTKAVFGNFGFLVSPVYDSNHQRTTDTVFSLVNTVTNETISSMHCFNRDSLAVAPVYSANFRYVVFANSYAFDTKTGKSFCTQPIGKKNPRPFEITAVDNDGNLYGMADKDYLKVNLADNTKVETVATDPSIPLVFTSKGSAIFTPDRSGNVVVVPSKNPTQG